MNREDEYYGVLGQKQLAALKREMLPCFESAVVRATHKVMAELEQENSMTDHELRDCPRCGHCCPQPEQEPVAWRYDQAKYRTNDLRGRQWAFNVFSQTRPYIDEMVQNVTPLYTTPPAVQPEQEPVKDELDFWALFDENQRLRAELKFNTTPPQQWVGLTDEEIKRLWSQSLADSEGETYLPLQEYAQAIETKLREKNGG